MADGPLVRLRMFFSHNSTRGEVAIAEYTQFYKACSIEERKDFVRLVGLWDGKSTYIPLDLQPATEAVAVTVAA